MAQCLESGGASKEAQLQATYATSVQRLGMLLLQDAQDIDTVAAAAAFQVGQLVQPFFRLMPAPVHTQLLPWM